MYTRIKSSALLEFRLPLFDLSFEGNDMDEIR
jgi:hypothetical protein